MVLDLNTCSPYQLSTLPGIDHNFARSLVAHRKKNGTFRHIEDLWKIDGMNNSKYQILKKHSEPGGLPKTRIPVQHHLRRAYCTDSVPVVNLVCQGQSMTNYIDNGVHGHSQSNDVILQPLSGDQLHLPAHRLKKFCAESGDKAIPQTSSQRVLNLKKEKGVITNVGLEPSVMNLTTHKATNGSHHDPLKFLVMEGHNNPDKSKIKVTTPKLLYQHGTPKTLASWREALACTRKLQLFQPKEVFQKPESPKEKEEDETKSPAILLRPSVSGNNINFSCTIDKRLLNNLDSPLNLQFNASHADVRSEDSREPENNVENDKPKVESCQMCKDGVPVDNQSDRCPPKGEAAFITECDDEGLMDGASGKRGWPCSVDRCRGWETSTSGVGTAQTPSSSTHQPLLMENLILYDKKNRLSSLDKEQAISSWITDVNISRNIGVRIAAKKVKSSPDQLMSRFRGLHQTLNSDRQKQPGFGQSKSQRKIVNAPKAPKELIKETGTPLQSSAPCPTPVTSARSGNLPTVNENKPNEVQTGKEQIDTSTTKKPNLNGIPEARDKAKVRKIVAKQTPSLTVRNKSQRISASANSAILGFVQKRARSMLQKSSGKLSGTTSLPSSPNASPTNSPSGSKGLQLSPRKRHKSAVGPSGRLNTKTNGSAPKPTLLRKPHPKKSKAKVQKVSQRH